MITKKEFKEQCHYTSYKGYGVRYNAFLFGYKDSTWKYMVWANTMDMTKTALFDTFYNWIKENEGKEPNLESLPFYVNVRYAPTDEKRFKVPIHLR